MAIELEKWSLIRVRLSNSTQSSNFVKLHYRMERTWQIVRSECNCETVPLCITIITVNDWSNKYEWTDRVLIHAPKRYWIAHIGLLIIPRTQYRIMYRVLRNCWGCMWRRGHRFLPKWYPLCTERDVYLRQLTPTPLLIYPCSSKMP